MYWLSSKQLRAWYATIQSGDDPALLLKRFTIKMDKYHQRDIGVKIGICVIVFVRTIGKVWVYDSNEDNLVFLWILHVSNWIIWIFGIGIIVMFTWSLGQIKNLRPQNTTSLHLQFF